MQLSFGMLLLIFIQKKRIFTIIQIEELQYLLNWIVKDSLCLTTRK